MTFRTQLLRHAALCAALLVPVSALAGNADSFYLSGDAALQAGAITAGVPLLSNATTVGPSGDLPEPSICAESLLPQQLSPRSVVAHTCAGPTNTRVAPETPSIRTGVGL
jgi:hypothetical protein